MEWFKTWFNTPYYHILYQDRDYEEGERFLENLIEKLNLNTDANIIDLACGKGRHSVFMNEMGFNVLGLDLSVESIAHNKTFENETLHFKVHDMREDIKSEKVNAVFNLFTSFGYFKTEEEDQSVFNSVSKILLKEGLFVLDFMNAESVKDQLQETEQIIKSGVTFNIQKKIVDQQILKDIRFTDKGIDHHFQENVQLHDLDSINNLAKNSGLERTELWGDYNLGIFNEKNSPRCINVFKKL